MLKALWIAVLSLWILAIVICNTVKWLIYCNRRTKLPRTGADEDILMLCT